MTTLIIAIAYILSIFISRWLNKKLFEVDSIDVILFIWFIPLFNIMFMLIGILFCIDEFDIKRKTWFTGKNWKQKE